MSGLLLKELYMARKYCRLHLVITVLFLGMAMLPSAENLFLLFYPSAMASFIPVTLLSYDTQSKWDVYFDTLPTSRAQYVSAKYLIGLILGELVLALTAVPAAGHSAERRDRIEPTAASAVGFASHHLGAADAVPTPDFQIGGGKGKNLVSGYDCGYLWRRCGPDRGCEGLGELLPAGKFVGLAAPGGDCAVCPVLAALHPAVPNPGTVIP